MTQDRSPSAPQIPFDESAERTVAGCVVATSHGAALAAERLTAADFYDPALGRLFAAAVRLVDVDTEADRVARAAAAADVPEEDVQALVLDRPLQWDVNGAVAARVRDAGRRRRSMAVAARIYGDAATVAIEDLRSLGERLVEILAA